MLCICKQRFLLNLSGGGPITENTEHCLVEEKARGARAPHDLKSSLGG